MNIIRRIQKIYAQIDTRVAEILKHHGHRIQCRKTCCDCCGDDLTVFEVEALSIQHHFATLLATAIAHPEGKCAFLDPEGACRIYAFRPYVCRTQGLPLRWIEGQEPGRVVEFRDICPLNEPGAPIEFLSADACWTIGPVESQLATLQRRHDGGAMKRVGLRSLFTRALK